MKIDRSSATNISAPIDSTPQETQKTTQVSAQQTSPAQTQGEQKGAIAAKGMMDTTARITQAQLQQVGSTKLSAIDPRVVNAAATKLTNALPAMIRSSQSDPNKLVDSVNNHIKDSAVQSGFGPNADIEAICFLVLMQAAKSAQEDLKSIMDQVKSINNAKSSLRDIMDKINDSSAAQIKKDDDDDP